MAQLGGFGDKAIEEFAGFIYGPAVEKSCTIGGRRYGAGERVDTMALAPEVVDLIHRAFDTLCPPWFWERAASRTNKYHPDISCGDGGLVRHVKLATWWGAELLRQYTESDNVKHTFHDEIIAALILHDVLKDGDPEKDGERRINRNEDGSLPNGAGPWIKRIGGCHGVDMAMAMHDRLLGGSPDACQARILRAVAGHMGRWTYPERFQPSTITEPKTAFVANLVHQADYSASRKCDAYAASLMEAVAPVAISETE